jgi:hypothetical protein
VIYRHRMTAGPSGVNNFRPQHLVTKAILRRFADPSTGQLEVLDKDEMRVRASGPNGVCWLDFFVHDHPEEIEQVWGRREKGLGPFYQALLAGTLLDSDAAVQRARTMLALHAARSHTYLEIANTARNIAKKTVRDGLLADLPHELANQIRSRSIDEQTAIGRLVAAFPETRPRTRNLEIAGRWRPTNSASISSLGISSMTTSFRD